MWVMTPFGILMPSIRPKDTVPTGDNRTIQVRTRREQDLEILRDEYMGDELGPIMVTPDMDYNFRAYCTPEAWGRALFQMATEIDYEKFKPTTDRYNDHELHRVYNSIWGTVCSLNGPWGGFNWKASNAARAGNVLDVPKKKVTATSPFMSSPRPLTEGYTRVAGPPEGTSYTGYVWDKKPVTDPEIIPLSVAPEEDEAEFSNLVQMPTTPTEFFDILMSLSESEIDAYLTEEEQERLAAKLLHWTATEDLKQIAE